MNRRCFSIRCIISMIFLLFLSSSLAFAGFSDKNLRAIYNKKKVYYQEKSLVEFGPRVAGSDVEKAAADHIENEMKRIGLDVEQQTFEAYYFEEITPPVLEQTTPDSIAYEPGLDFATMTFSGAGDVNGILQAVDLDLPPSGNSSSGCEPEDFADFISGSIALIQRGSCTFGEKARNAETFGAAGVIIFNEGNDDSPDRTDIFFGTLGEPGFTIPVVSASFALGQDLAESLSANDIEIHLAVDSLSELRSSQNVIGTLESDQSDQGIVYIGAHYDSVSAGPGANDNATGVAAILEAARVLKLKKKCVPTTLKFIAFGAEEIGLDGSYNYVQENFDEVGAMGLGMINLDMIGVGDILQIGHIGAYENSGPQLVEYAQQKATELGLTWEAFEAQENSDHTYFEQAGIPAVFLTQSEDPNYHTAEDTIDKIQFDTLEDNGELATITMLGWATEAMFEPSETATLFKSMNAQINKRHVYHDVEYLTE